MLYILTTNPGIEDIVELEVREKLDGKTIQKFLGLAGRVLVDTNESKRLFSLRSIYHIIRYIDQFEIDRLDDIYDYLKTIEIEEMNNANTFRVTSNRIGEHDFTSIDIQRVAGQAIVDRYAKRVDLENYDIDIICDVIGNRCIVGVKLTRESLHKRYKHRFVHPAAIKAPLAYAMLRLASIKEGSLLDPFCGGGTIVIEAASIYDKLKIYASDINEEYIEGAKKNAEAAGVKERIEFRVCNAEKLDKYYTSIDAIVTNPPYGIRMGKKINLKELYKNFLIAASKVINKDGRLVIITRKAVSFRKLTLNTNKFYLEHERVVESGDLYPHIFVLRRL
ncbi:MAG: methyltransferase domain-containing protein [Candidatus Nitrosothermus koennekii]|nr:MAG: methyltransferase domain-containing protein [Candidatus Nitrosothermus koennekii]